MNFDDIRSYTEEELPEVMQRLVDEKHFMKLLSTIFPLTPKDYLREQLLKVKTVEEFQSVFAYPFLKDLEANKTDGIKFEGLDKINKIDPYLFISNHRDITLDASLLWLQTMENSMDAINIAIGDNLLIYQWIEYLLRYNRAFIVKRNLKARQALEASQKLSAYIRHLICDKKESVWLAQREGRAKDSNDLTQEGLLRMLTYGGTGNFYENMSELHICPLVICYEYDPTDYLKAKEFQVKRDNPEYKKEKSDDLQNMEVGIMGYKGKVVYRLTGEIDKELKEITQSTNSLKEQIKLLAQVIDYRIHSNYTIFNTNKIAYDLLKKEKFFSEEYTDMERSEFEQYISRQIAKIDIPDKDSAFLRIKILEMYANPLINHMIAKNKSLII